LIPASRIVAFRSALARNASSAAASLPPRYRLSRFGLSASRLTCVVKMPALRRAEAWLSKARFQAAKSSTSWVTTTAAVAV